MRKIAIGFAALTLVVAAAIPASAAVLLSEGFPYADGDLVPNGGWAIHSGAGTDIKMISGRAVVDMNNAPDDNRSFAAQSATAKTYYCLEVMVPAIVGSPRLNYFAHLKDTGTSNFAGRLGLSPSGNTFTFAVGSTAFTTPTLWGTALAYDTNYRVVVAYDAATGTSQMWVNPANELSTNVSSTGAAGTLISSFALRQSNTGTGTLWKASVDNVGVGNTFDEACSQITPTNTSTWGRVKVLYR
jgi:hypothetical protein